MIRRTAALASGSILALAAATQAVADHTAPAASVALVGDLQSEIGCPGDWQPECSASELTFANGVWRGTFFLPAGAYEYKVALNDSWDENYGAGGGAGGNNIPLTVGVASEVTFTYDPASHVTSNDAQPLSVTIPGSFQSELGCGSDWTRPARSRTSSSTRPTGSGRTRSTSRPARGSTRSRSTDRGMRITAAEPNATARTSSSISPLPAR